MVENVIQLSTPARDVTGFKITLWGNSAYHALILQANGELATAILPHILKKKAQ
jgi:hypothetical protein